MKEATSGMIFYGFYEGFKSMNFPGGVAGSSSALLAMTMTYPVDVLKTRVQAGETVVFLANPQSEADAAFIPLLTMDSHPGEACLRRQS
jgi:hypothetical protein